MQRSREGQNTDPNSLVARNFVQKELMQSFSRADASVDLAANVDSEYHIAKTALPPLNSLLRLDFCLSRRSGADDRERTVRGERTRMDLVRDAR